MDSSTSASSSTHNNKIARTTTTDTTPDTAPNSPPPYTPLDPLPLSTLDSPQHSSTPVLQLPFSTPKKPTTTSSPPSVSPVAPHPTFPTPQIRPSSITPGLRGLQNLGNTCFMNSALQCMSNTPFLNDQYFNSDAWVHEVNKLNPLGMKGDMAITYAALVRALWSPISTQKSVSPRKFKFVMAQFAPQFSGYAQHDSSELLGFLLDGLHEDLNRVHCKPYFESKDDDSRSDVDLANEQWANHRARNDSIIVDLFQGQYKSRVQCLSCCNISTTFDPFMVLTLPIPSTPTLVPIQVWAVRLPEHATEPATKMTVWVRQDGSVGDLVRSVIKFAFTTGPSYSGRAVVYEVHQSHVYSHLPEYRLVSEMTSSDQIWVVELPKSEFGAPTGYPTLPTALPDSPMPDTFTVTSDTDAVTDPSVSSFHSSTTLHSLPAVSPPPTQTVTVLLSHQKQGASSNHRPSYYSTGGGPYFGLPVVAYFVSPFNAPQATSAVIASMQRWTTFPIHAYLSANPAIDPVELIRFGVEQRQGLFDGLVDGMAVSAYTKIRVLWDVQVAELLFADSAAPSRGFDLVVPAYQYSNADGTLVNVEMSDLNVNGYASLPGSASPVLDTGSEGIVFPQETTPSPSPTSSSSSSGLSDKKELGGVEYTGHNLWSSIPDLGPMNAPPKRNPGRSSYTLDECFDTFVGEERLGALDPVYCRKCAKHQEASKKVDIWRAPLILVIALKRFGMGNRYRRDKIDAMVECPMVLDMNGRVLEPSSGSGGMVYDLYAVSNHYGGMGGGHYTAYAQNAHTQSWHEFDDSRVSSISPNQVVSPASYVLFYRRRGPIHCQIPEPSKTVSETDMQEMISQDVESVPNWTSSSAPGSGNYGLSSGNVYSSPRSTVTTDPPLTTLHHTLSSTPPVTPPSPATSQSSWKPAPAVPRRTMPAAISTFSGTGQRLDGSPVGAPESVGGPPSDPMDVDPEPLAHTLPDLPGSPPRDA